MKLALAIAIVLAAAGGARADEPHAEFQLNGGSPHVDVPFELDMKVDGFDEAPAPEVPKLDIADATITPLGATPNVARRLMLMNGRRTEERTVTWVLRWRIEVHKEGKLHVPATSVNQGAKHAAARPGEVTVDTIPTTDDMRLALELPQRAVFVGETIPVTLTWLFRQQPEDQTFTVPLMSLDTFTVSVPPATDRGHALKFEAGGKEFAVPYAADTTEVNGMQFHRIRFTFFAAPRKTGKVEVPAASVVAAMAVGRADFFGNAPSRPFRASDTVHALDVKPLPETDKPASFTGAVGDQFSMTVRTSRSVVQLGEPVELAITVKSDQRLDTLALGKLDGEGGLPKDKFTMPADAPAGELSDDGKTKTFKVTAQLIGPATEIPALGFAYFDPAKGSYQTIHSDPIALSVKGGSVVGANDVIASTPRKPSGGSAVAESDLALVNADLALSSPGAAEDKPLGGAILWIVIGLLYATPLAIFGVRSWQHRTRGQREDAAGVRTARRKLESELARAKTAPARDTAGPLGSALRGLARALGRGADDALLATLETESFAPSAAELPLSAEVRRRAEQLMERWIVEARTSKGKSAVSAAIAIALIGISARAEAATLEGGRAAYQEAMQQSDASARKAAFARAAAALAESARETPDRPELLTDWGNAALGAGDVAAATLAYRRALMIDGANARARHNLAWLRGRQADTFRPVVGGAADTLFFFHQWPRTRRLLVGAAAFAACILLVVPWGGRRRRGLSALAVLPFAVWAAMVASVVLEDRHADDAVVMDDVILRAADSTGAPAALVTPLPRGAEVTVLERRDAWTKIRIASGTAGWVQGGAVEPIVIR